MEKIYVLGHKNPDTDSIVSAMSMASFLNLRERTDRYKAVMPGTPNSETEYVFERFGIMFPEKMLDVKGKTIFLVDHNEESQTIEGRTNDNVAGIVDHHKIKFGNSKPIEITTKPWGSSNTIIYDLFKKELIDVPEHLKSSMLAAILSDTVILKSPTTTPIDIMVVEELSDELGIDYQELGMEMFKAKSDLKSKTAMQIIKNDFKDFEFSGNKVGVGQVETPDLSDIENRLTQIVAEMNKLMEKESYHSLLLMLTDIMQEGSKLVIVSKDESRIAKMFSTELEQNLSGFIPGMMSRKKQVAPVLNENL